MKRIDTCRDTCEWEQGEWTECEKVPVCTPNEVKKDPVSVPCGNCGESWRYSQCNPDGCDWGQSGDPGPCEGEGVCTPNQETQKQDPCEMCGTVSSTATCTPTCEWGNWVAGTCANQGACEPDDVEVNTSARCGACDGIRGEKKICKSTCQWGEWEATSSCVECAGDPLNSCDAETQTCQCTASPNSCGDGNRCCVQPEGFRVPNYCLKTSIVCDFHCQNDDAKCLDGYECDVRTCVKVAP